MQRLGQDARGAQQQAAQQQAAERGETAGALARAKAAARGEAQAETKGAARAARTRGTSAGARPGALRWAAGMALARAAWMALAAGMTLVLAACSKPEPPVLRALDAQVTNLTPAAVELLVRVEAYNPNRFGLTAQSVTSHLVVDGRIDLGTATLPGPIALPAEGRTTVQLPVTLPFRDAGTVALLAATGAPVPYTVDGTARIGGERLNVEVPFRVEGALSQADFVRATLRSLPGLTVPPP